MRPVLDSPPGKRVVQEKLSRQGRAIGTVVALGTVIGLGAAVVALIAGMVT